MSAPAVHSALYRGELVHARTDALARRAFRYGVYMAAIDLDELAALDRALRLFSRGRGALFSFDERDYAATLSPSARGTAGELRAELAALRAGNGLPAPHATRVVTNLRAFGYLFNPVSFFIDYAASGEITSAIAEVNNTYGGRLRYVLGPRDRVPGGRVAAPGGHPAPLASGRVATPGGHPAPLASGHVATFRHTRELFVSPFLHGALDYEFAFDAPLDGDRVAIAMRVRDAAGTQVFYARFSGARAALSDRTLAAAALRYPFMTARVIGLIHWQALRLALRGVPYRRPSADHRPLATP